MSITQQHFREILDELEICHMIYRNSGIIEFIMRQTKPFTADFKFLFRVDESRMMIQGQALLCDRDLDDADGFRPAYRFCNRWHNDMVISKVMVNEEGRFLLCEWSWNTDYEISDEQLKNLIIAKFMSSSECCISKAVESGLYPMVKSVGA